MIHPKTQEQVPCSLNLDKIIKKIVQNKELWDELQHELRKRKVVTNLATKEVLINFLSSRLKDVEMGESVTDCTNEPLTHVIKDWDTEKKEKKSFIANPLHRNEFSRGKMNPLQTPSKYALPHFDLKNMTLGNRLGKGSQSVVYEVDSFWETSFDPLCNKENIKEYTHKNGRDRKFNLMSHSPECKEQLPKKYAAKLPHQSNDSEKYKENVKDLLHESAILSSVDHPNIIKIHGISSIEASQSGSSQTSEPFFLILDRLSYDFEELLKAWASKKNNINILKFQTFKEESFRHRLKIARDIATAMKHLHEKNIMHRDLKPANIGFDSQGQLKLFDFGFATKLQAKDCLPNGKYKLDGGIGTCRYMAPEVARYEPYNELVDVYSFGILMWEILTLEKPYKKLNCNQWLQQVVVEGKRPDIDESWPTILQYLLKCCWSEDINERPSFDVIIDVLDEI